MSDKRWSRRRRRMTRRRRRGNGMKLIPFAKRRHPLRFRGDGEPRWETDKWRRKEAA